MDRWLSTAFGGGIGGVVGGLFALATCEEVNSGAVQSSYSCPIGGVFESFPAALTTHAGISGFLLFTGTIAVKEWKKWHEEKRLAADDAYQAMLRNLNSKAREKS